VLPSMILTLAFGSAVPVRMSFAVMPSVEDQPVSPASFIVTIGIVGGIGGVDAADSQPSRFSSVRSDWVTELTTPGFANALNASLPALDAQSAKSPP